MCLFSMLRQSPTLTPTLGWFPNDLLGVRKLMTCDITLAYRAYLNSLGCPNISLHLDTDKVLSLLF